MSLSQSPRAADMFLTS